jgi:hypothetical protein
MEEVLSSVLNARFKTSVALQKCFPVSNIHDIKNRKIPCIQINRWKQNNKGNDKFFRGKEVGKCYTFKLPNGQAISRDVSVLYKNGSD